MEEQDGGGEAVEPVDGDGRVRRRVRGRRLPSRRTWALAGVALLCGAVLNLAFPPIGWWWLAPLPVLALSALTDGRSGKSAAFIGLGFGTGFCWVVFQWLRVFGPGAQEAVGVIESLYFIPLGWGLARASRTRFAPLWQACLWVGMEFLRDRYPFGGFSWGRLAFIQPDSVFTPLAAVGGAPLLTFAVALCGTLLWRAVVVARRGGLRGAGLDVAGGRRKLVWVAVLAVGALAVPLAGSVVPLTSSDSGTPLRIALIQGNVPRTGLNRDDQMAAVLSHHVAETKVLAAQVAAGQVPKPDVVVWPENGSDLDPYTDPAAQREISDAVAAVGVPVLVGAVIDAPGGQKVLNRLIVWDPATGMGQTYDKTHLVPFGEYLPFRGVLTKVVKRFNQIPRDFEPGHGVGTLQLGPVKVAAVMCFEVAYDGVVRDAVDGGGTVLLVPSNNASYMRTGQTYQQLAIARVRAVEHGRWTMEVATSGVSAVIAPDGSVVSKTGEYQAAFLDAQVRENTGRTLADRLGAWPEWVMALAGLLAAALAGPRGRALVRRTRFGAGSLPVAQSDENAIQNAAFENPTADPERDVPLASAAKGRAR
jgi:apolipoprotein N-acyltransferase